MELQLRPLFNLTENMITCLYMVLNHFCKKSDLDTLILNPSCIDNDLVTVISKLGIRHKYTTENYSRRDNISRLFFIFMRSGKVRNIKNIRQAKIGSDYYLVKISVKINRQIELNNNWLTYLCQVFLGMLSEEIR